MEGANKGKVLFIFVISSFIGKVRLLPFLYNNCLERGTYNNSLFLGRKVDNRAGSNILLRLICDLVNTQSYSSKLLLSSGKLHPDNVGNSYHSVAQTVSDC